MRENQLCNSGAEANEAAIKFARKVSYKNGTMPEKHEIVTFSWAFHGRTMGALAFTVLMAVLLNRDSDLAGVFQKGHFHDYGNLLLAFTMLWAMRSTANLQYSVCEPRRYSSSTVAPVGAMTSRTT